MLAEIRALRRRAVVTGIGVLTGPVVGADAFWDQLSDPTERPTFTRLEGFDPRHWLKRREARHTDRFAQVGLAAAVLAARDADLGETEPLRTGVVMGTGGGSTSGLVVQELGNFRQYGAPGVSPLLGVKGMSNAGTAIIALQQQAQGETMSISSGCASGSHAVGHGMRLVQLGLCDVVYAGSAEVFYAPPGDEFGEELSEAMISGLANMKVLTDGPTSRPFDVDRDGFVCADGGAVLIIEERERALARGAHIYCEVCGYGNTNDAGDLISPRLDGALLMEAMRAAVTDAGADGSDVRFVNVHGTATRTNDVAEALAIGGLCGRPGPAVNSIKGLVGHSGAGAGAVEAASVALAIDRKVLPPTHGLRAVDPEITVDVVQGEPRPWEPGLALSCNVSLGGHNGCVAFRPA